MALISCAHLAILAARSAARRWIFQEKWANFWETRDGAADKVSASRYSQSYKNSFSLSERVKGEKRRSPMMVTLLARDLDSRPALRRGRSGDARARLGRTRAGLSKTVGPQLRYFCNGVAMNGAYRDALRVSRVSATTSRQHFCRHSSRRSPPNLANTLRRDARVE